MKMLLQFGHGMIDLSVGLIKAWQGGGVILSPRDLDDVQLATFSKRINKIPGGFCLLDPQHYNPRATHYRLVAHDFWPAGYDTSSFWTDNIHLDYLRQIKENNDQLKTQRIIAPGPLLQKSDAAWKDRFNTIVDGFEKIGVGADYYLTVALSEERALSVEFIHELLDELEKYKIFGIYLVAEHPKNKYLVEDVDWLANILDLIAGCRLQGKEVILGYCNHQMLIAGCAGVNHIASGTWVNVRSFPIDKFNQKDDDGEGRRATWYYFPQGLSEFKVKDLDTAWKRKILNDLQPEKSLENSYSAPIFMGPQPTTVFKEPNAFRHYLHCLKLQSEAIQGSTFAATVDAYKAGLDASEKSLEHIHQHGIKGTYKDFEDIFNINRVALKALNEARGAILGRKWSTLVPGESESQSA